MKIVRIGSRKSQLALTQTRRVAASLENAWPDLTCEIVHFITEGDKILDKPLAQIGGKGLFTLELERALRAGSIDLAVHSLKDLPVEQPVGLTLGAIPERESTNDVLIAKNGWTLATLPGGAVIGTSSPRRKAQLLARRPDLNIASIRGNIDTRIRKALKSDAYDAVVLAAAGVRRLGLEANVTDANLEMLPAPGQGALGVQCRADDEATLKLLQAIEHREVRACVSAERMLLTALGGGCSAPIAALAEPVEAGFKLSGWIGNAAATRHLHETAAGDDPKELAERLAAIFEKRGAKKLMSVPAMPFSKNKRVVITRGASQSGDLAHKLREFGLESLVCPTIDFAALPPAPLLAALENFAEYDWLIFTSVNAVRFFEKIASSVDLNLANRPKLAVIGEATAAKLSSVYGRPDFVPEKFSAKNLVAGLGEVSGQRILLPRAKIGRPLIVEMLRERGAHVDDIALYDTVPVAPTKALVAELENGFGAVAFASPSSVRNFIAMLERNGLELPPETIVACIGSSTAEEAEKHGLSVAILPKKQTIDGLAQALVRMFE